MPMKLYNKSVIGKGSGTGETNMHARYTQGNIQACV